MNDETNKTGCKCSNCHCSQEVEAKKEHKEEESDHSACCGKPVSR